MMKQKTYFDFVNVTKLLLAISIVAIHSALVSKYAYSMALICRLGVPYFFVASGFFLQKKSKSGHTSDAAKGYLKRLFLPYAVFSVIWILELTIDYYLEGLSLGESVLRIIQFLVFCPNGGLWYVWASMIGVLLLYPFMQRRKLLHGLPIGVALFAIGLLANNYYFLAEQSTWLKPVVDRYLEICIASNNGLFVGFVFLLIGMLISEYYDAITERVTIKVGLFLLGVSLVLSILELRFIRSKESGVGDGAFYLSQLVYVPTAFYLTTRIKCSHLSRELSTTAKNLSTGIYFLHLPILWIIHRSAKYLLPRIPALARFAPFFDHPSVCFAACLAICLAICLLAYRRPKSFLCKILK